MLTVLRRQSHRGVPLVLGLHALSMALLLLIEERAGEARYSGNMPYGMLYAVAGVACLWFHAHPRSAAAWRYSMALLFGAYLARGLLIGWEGFEQGWEPKHFIGLATWAGWGLVVLQIWRHYLTPGRS